MIYHVGFLPLDREPTLARTSSGATDAMIVDGVASRAYQDYEVGKVMLTQKRLSEFVYEYHLIPYKGRPHDKRRGSPGAQQAGARSATASSAR
jgi:hypothetical protein